MKYKCTDLIASRPY